MPVPVLTSASANPLKRNVLRSIALLMLLLAGATLTSDVIAIVLLRQQDMLLALLLVVFATLALLPFGLIKWPVLLGPPSLLLLSLVLALICYAGHYWLLLGYDFTRDEQMANFDAAILSAGRLVWPLAPAWQDHAATLNLRFMLRVEQPVAWVSDYLPMNAAIRAAIGKIADPALTGPLLTGLSLPLLWACARRIWPADRETAAICVLMLASAGQVVMTGMTSYAMPAHLFFSLLWLWLFLANQRVADVGALLVGLVATGLHQPLFHPMFVTPFIALLLLDRNWRRLAIFVPGYAAIMIFWLLWPLHIHSLIAPPHAAHAAANSDYLARLLAALSGNKDNVSTMAANLLRFCTWQNILLLPLLLASWPAIRNDRFAAALAAGFVLPLLAMMLILPSQGHGFGYRYVHPVLGNVMLLAGYGWSELARWHERLRPALLAGVAASFLILMPVQAWMAHRLYAPFAQASARIDATQATYAIIRDGHMAVMHDLVINRPDLSNRPIRLLDPAIADLITLAGNICRPSVRVALPADSFFIPLTESLGLQPGLPDDGQLATKRKILEDAGCEAAVLL